MLRKVVAVWISLVMIFGFIVLVDTTMDLIPTTKGATLFVNTTGTGGAYTSIQEAINNATLGDTVYVYGGTYNEYIAIDKTINLIGESRDNTTIMGGPSGNTILITADYVNITQFTVICNSFSSWDNGMNLRNVRNCNMSSNNVISNNSKSIYIDTSNNNILLNNNVTSKGDAIELFLSINNTFVDNRILEGGIDITGYFVEYWNTHSIDTSNTVNGKSIHYLKNQNGNIVPPDAGQVILANCSNIQVKNQNITNTSFGIQLGFSSYNNISYNNILMNSKSGIYLTSSLNNTILNNNISDNSYGIYFIYSELCKVTANNVSSNNNIDISLSYSNRNEFSNNNASNGYGIYLHYSNNNNFTGNTASSNYERGILLSRSDNNNISNNNFSFNKYGIRLDYSISNFLSNNTMIEDGIYFNGNLQEHWNSHDIDTLNSVNGKPVYFWKDQTLGTVPLDAGQVILANCTNITVVNQELSYGSVGIELGFSSNNNVTNCNTSNNKYAGIRLLYSNDNNIIDNHASFNNYAGVRLYSSNNNIIKRNIAGINENGISIRNSDGNTISYNTAFLNANGIYLRGNNNLIFHNNIIDNTLRQAYDVLNSNQWDDGYPNGGNYWSDYIGFDNFKSPNQDQPGSDGIGDTNFSIETGSVDNYPLIELIENYTILKYGWNLISIPLIQENQNLRKILEMIDGFYDAVQWYDITNSSDHWKHHKIDKPFGNDLNELNETQSFWIRITNPGDTIFLYNGTQPSSNQTIQLHPGWNMVGYPSSTRYNRSEGLNNLEFNTDVDCIQWCDAATKTWHFMGPDDHFSPGRGYWVHATREAGWEVPF